jgi:chromosome segregation ATPase
MDLEDLVDRLQAERDNPTSIANKRTSDYFSDSGYSSAKFSEYDQSREEIEKIQRRSEQEKAQVRLELTNKLQDERSRRQQLDQQIKHLSEKASRVDLAQMNHIDASGRVKELENACETLRRRLAEERQVKDNFEDLLTALKGELESASNERDNLRDEIVPQLRARVEGLEGQAGDFEKMTYEATKIQQELQALKTENSSLKQSQSRPMSNISEESTGALLSRSNSVNGTVPAFKLQRPPSGLSRSKSVKSSESREQLSERLKDVEEQRDALHRALKNLLDRQEFQNRENEKKIQSLEMERDRLLTASPQKSGFKRDISILRAEINVLRRRAEEALEQKWQVEKGLGGLKMDLDRAEQEIASLRSLLDEKDILILPSLMRSSSGSDVGAEPVSSQSLTDAFGGLQKAYTDSLERIKKVEIGSTSPDDRTYMAMQKLEEMLSVTLSERDLARQESTTYQQQLEILKAGEKKYLDSENALADELRESARRVEELAVQVRQQLDTNHTLRQRMAESVSRGEADQKANKERITMMQACLRSLEEKLEAAQAASEERVARHEEEMQALRESHNTQLSRLQSGLLSPGLKSPRSPRTFPPKSPLSPLFTAPGARTPKLISTRLGLGISVTEETQVDNLRARVAELENALADADLEMEQVVGRMNTAQIEVLQLQEEREAAIRQTRRLEQEIQAERVKAFEERFKSLQS